MAGAIAPPIAAQVSLVNCTQATELPMGGESQVYCGVRVATARDTVTAIGLWVVNPPYFVGDSMLVGVGSADTVSSLRLFRYNVRRRRIAFFSMPSGIMPGIADLSVSPDGRYVAYVSLSERTLATGFVRVFPNGRILAQTPSIDVGPTDMPVGGARWPAFDSVEILFQTEQLAWDRWIRFRGTIPISHWQVDTLRVEQTTR